MVEIKVTGNMPLEALANLTALGMHCMKNSEVHAAAIRILETEKNTEKKKTALAVETLPADPPGPAAGETGPTAAPSEEAAPPAPAPIPEESPAPKSATSKAPSLDIRAKGIEAAKKHGQPAIKAILKELGAENMTNLPEDKRVLFLEKLEGLGEGNG